MRAINGGRTRDNHNHKVGLYHWAITAIYYWKRSFRTNNSNVIFVIDVQFADIYYNLLQRRVITDPVTVVVSVHLIYFFDNEQLDLVRFVVHVDN